MGLIPYLETFNQSLYQTTWSVHMNVYQDFSCSTCLCHWKEVTQCTLNNFVDDTNLGEPVHKLEDRAATQRGLDRWEELADIKIMKLKKGQMYSLTHGKPASNSVIGWRLRN